MTLRNQLQYPSVTGTIDNTIILESYSVTRVHVCIYYLFWDIVISSSPYAS